MFKLLKKVIGYLISIVLIVGGLYFLSGQLSSNHRLGTIRAKHQRLESLPGRRMILVGGSNLHYGIDSELLQQRSGYSVVNMGLQGSLGLEFMLNEVVDDVRTGDLVVLLPENRLICAVPLEGEDTVYELVSKVPEMGKHLTFSQRLRAVKSAGSTINENCIYLVSYLALRMNGKQTVAELTNEFGDFVGHEGKSSMLKPAKEVPATESVNQDVLHVIRTFRKTIEARDARLAIGFAPIAKSYANLEELVQIENALPAELRIGQISKYVYPDDYFYDTPHHLTFDRRRERTLQLLDDLGGLIRKKNSASASHIEPAILPEPD